MPLVGELLLLGVEGVPDEEAELPGSLAFLGGGGKGQEADRRAD